MSRNHPYLGKPDYQFWSKEPAIKSGKDFDPIVKVSFSLDEKEPIATAGSCFAQHVAKALQRVKFNYLVCEKTHEIVPAKVAEKYHYGAFTARYGNVYTARQLRQLLERAYGRFDPLDRAWAGKRKEVVDPFRPQIQPGGYVNVTELEADRTVHLAAVRQAVESLSCFVFTLGLTEAWVDQRDGAVFPLAPGVAGGTFDPEIYAFKNFTVSEVIEDLQWSLDFIRSINPAAKFIITVSPVALNATYLDRHVLTSTVYSKSVLRVAAEAVCEATDTCDYFPSYEIVNNPFHRQTAFAEDCREVKPEAVAYVMSLFLKHYAGVEVAPKAMMPAGAAREARKEARAAARGKDRPKARERAAARARGAGPGAQKQRRAAGEGGRKGAGRPQGERPAASAAQAAKREARKQKPGKDSFLQEMERLNDILCDEESISNE